MRTRWLMSASAVMMAALGLVATFLPQEVAARIGDGTAGRAVVLLQIIGGLYLGFAMLNWTARESVLGGIYNRPIVIGNLLHFTVVALALAKAVALSRSQIELIALTLLYVWFAIGFGRALFTSPVRAAVH